MTPYIPTSLTPATTNSMANGTLHAGHRERIRKRILEQGISSLAEHEVLEYVLFFAIPRKDTNELAHQLIAEFGSFAGVCNASYEALLSVKGITESAALFLTSFSDLSALYRAGSKESAHRQSVDEYAAQMAERIGFKAQEVQMAYCLDVNGKLLKVIQSAPGAVAQSTLDMRTLIQQINQSKAVNVILGHNHPSSSLVPSAEDWDSMSRIEYVLGEMGICLIDSFIVARGEYVSMRKLAISDKR